MTTPTEETPLAPVLRCNVCAEPVIYVELSDFTGWAHNYAEIGERLKDAPIEVVQKALEADPTECFNELGLLDVGAGSYDEPWNSKQKTYATRQSLINNFKARNAALKAYWAE